MKSAREDIQRLLLIVPYVARHPGVRINVLARKLGVSPKRLRSDLERLCCIGRPPFCPDDLIDVEIDRGRVFVRQTQNFTHPPHLTLREACALWASIQFAMPLFKKSLARTRKRLQNALHASEREKFARVCQRLGVFETRIDATLETLAFAIQEFRTVKFDELIVECAQVIPRILEPWLLRERRGRWFLEGFCVGEKAPRNFAVERLCALALTGQRFERRGRAAHTEKACSIHVEAEETLIPWLLEELEAVELEWKQASGMRVLDVRPEPRGDFIRLVASLGGQVRILSPPEFAQAVVDVAHKALSVHASIEEAS